MASIDRPLDRDAEPAKPGPLDRDAEPAHPGPLDRDAEPAHPGPLDRDASSLGAAGGPMSLGAAGGPMSLGAAGGPMSLGRKAEAQESIRTRTFSWADPGAYAALIGRRSGLETLRLMVSGELPPPPALQAIGVDGLELAEGQVSVLLTPREFHYNPLGSVHGGVLSTLLDTAAGCTVHSVLPAGQGYTSLDLSVRFLRPVTMASGTLRCTGTIVSRTRRSALAEARLVDGSGELAAHATSSCLIFPLPAGGSPADRAPTGR